ncbi:SDR family oxidoreductase [soil metagenome]|uniref:SDR family NAD(P)-dependent oxidoreductase n=1 Tax=Sphingobium sp. BS19 TaxID=3018973 RepID=UPI0022ED56BD|nr:SDR family NAD(P)-dependent oxidoreductase [Sphingobium sp. BS19]GLI97533.1 SDR family oxidoreductase [Sphingobium sp. BS19]
MPDVAVVIGASGAIGDAVVRRLARDDRFGAVLALSRRPVETVDGVVSSAIDLRDEDGIAAAAGQAGALGAVRLVFVATGMLHDGAQQPEKSWRVLDAERLANSFAVNAIGPALVAKHFLPLFPREGRAVFAALSARVGSISDNRLGGWYGYRASKAALNQMVRTLAIELGRNRPEALCVALHPGTVTSDLSQPFTRGRDADDLFTPDQSAEYLLGVLDRLSPADSGGLFAWDGAAIPF